MIFGNITHVYTHTYQHNTHREPVIPYYLYSECIEFHERTLFRSKSHNIHNNNDNGLIINDESSSIKKSYSLNDTILRQKSNSKNINNHNDTDEKDKEWTNEDIKGTYNVYTMYIYTCTHVQFVCNILDLYI